MRRLGTEQPDQLLEAMALERHVADALPPRGGHAQKAEQRRAARARGRVVNFRAGSHHALGGAGQALVAPECFLINREEFGMRRHPGRRRPPARADFGRQRRRKSDAAFEQARRQCKKHTPGVDRNNRARGIARLQPHAVPAQFRLDDLKTQAERHPSANRPPAPRPAPPSRPRCERKTPSRHSRQSAGPARAATARPRHRHAPVARTRSAPILRPSRPSSAASAARTRRGRDRRPAESLAGLPPVPTDRIRPPSRSRASMRRKSRSAAARSRAA